MTDVAPALEELRAAGLLRAAAGRSRARRARASRSTAARSCCCARTTTSAWPGTRTCAPPPPRRPSAGAPAPAPRRSCRGNTALHARLEAELAAFKGSEACLLFGSGYLANTGVVAALAGPGDVVLSDALNHASIVDGCRLARAETVVYDHADLDALAAAPARAPHGRPALIVTDAVFSMDGDLAPLEGIVALARRHGARVVVDEAHATGVVGPGGARPRRRARASSARSTSWSGRSARRSAATARSSAATRRSRDFLVNRARTLIFSTALPPPALGAALEALRAAARASPELVAARCTRNARVLRAELAGHGFAVEPGDDADRPARRRRARSAAIALCEAALRRGVFAQAIRPPTVPEGTSRLRLVAIAAHAEDELREAADAFAAAARELELAGVA